MNLSPRFLAVYGWEGEKENRCCGCLRVICHPSDSFFFMSRNTVNTEYGVHMHTSRIRWDCWMKSLPWIAFDGSQDIRFVNIHAVRFNVHIDRKATTVKAYSISSASAGGCYVHIIGWATSNLDSHAWGSSTVNNFPPQALRGYPCLTYLFKSFSAWEHRYPPHPRHLPSFSPRCQIMIRLSALVKSFLMLIG